jgi:hypothetical protein
MINFLKLVRLAEEQGTSNTTYHESLVRVVNLLLIVSIGSLELGSNNLDCHFAPLVIPPSRLEVIELMARMKNYSSR